MRRLQGLYIQFARHLDPAANARIHALDRRLSADLLPGVTDLSPGYVNLYVEFDEAAVGRERVRAWVRRHLRGLQAPEGGPGAHTGSANNLVEIPVRYDGEDLPWVAQQTGLSVEGVIEKHSGQLYRVFAVGFVPGYPFMGVLDPALYLPRRPTPRKRVPAHSVAMAVSQTSVYTLPTPGGWHLLGSALQMVYDPNRREPFLLAPGDRVRFVPSQGETPPEPSPLELLPPEPRLPVLRVEEPGLLDLVMDGGRFRAAHFGMARGGAMDERSADLANRAAGNPAGTPLLELTLTGPVLAVLRPAVLVFAGFGMEARLGGELLTPGRSTPATPGQTLRFKPTATGARAYLAVAGGLEAGAFMGSRSTDLTGRVGRPLRAGDVLGLAGERSVVTGFGSSPPPLPDTVTVRLLSGPQATPEALRALASGEFRVSSPDRMGVRLEGPKVPGGELISEATPMGAVQITTSGDPILLLNDRGRIGGYAKPAVVDPRDLPLVAQLRPGQKLRFRVPEHAENGHWFIHAEEHTSPGDD